MVRKLKPRRNRKPSQLRQGEVIKIRSRFGMPVDGVFKVDSIESGLLAVSAGDLMMGLPLASIEVLERNLPEPQDWLSFEIDALRKHIVMYPCEECERNLEAKEKQLAASLNIH